MIHRITLEDFKGHEHTTVDCSQFTLLVGDNAVGKTTVLNALHLAGQAFAKDPRDLFVSARRFDALKRSRAGEGNPVGNPVVRLEFGAYESTLEVLPELADIELEWSGPTHASIPLIEKDILKKSAPPEIQFHRSSVVLHLEASSLAAPSTSEDEEPRLEFDGTGLATVLARLKVVDTARFELYQEAVRQVVPEFSGLQFDRVKRSRTFTELLTVEGSKVPVPKTETFIADALRVAFRGTASLDASAASEGTLLVMGLLAFLHLPKAPRLLLLDDIDRGLHPRAQLELVKAIRTVLKAHPEMQVLATSHSPYLVDAFDRSEVVVLSKSEGKVIARRLSEHADSSKVTTLSTGEFLTASGADWFGL